MKTAFLVSFVLAVVLVAASAGEFHDQSTVLGIPGYGDKLIAHEIAQKGPVNGTSLTYTYKYPKRDLGKYITCVRVLDTWLNGTNGDVLITDGGVGHSEVGLTIHSKAGYGISYIIGVWGH